jgi:hypothetical protein
MEPLGSLADRILPALVSNQPLTPEKVDFAWRVSVGAAIDRALPIVTRLQMPLAVENPRDVGPDRIVSELAVACGSTLALEPELDYIRGPRGGAVHPRRR